MLPEGLRGTTRQRGHDSRENAGLLRGITSLCFSSQSQLSRSFVCVTVRNLSLVLNFCFVSLMAWLADVGAIGATAVLGEDSTSTATRVVPLSRAIPEGPATTSTVSAATATAQALIKDMPTFSTFSRLRASSSRFTTATSYPTFTTPAYSKLLADAFRAIPQLRKGG